MSFIQYDSFSKFSEIAHFCSSRHGGVSKGDYTSLNLSPFSGDKAENFAENKAILCETFKILPEKLVIPFQIHATKVREIENSFFDLPASERVNFLNGVDALFTRIPEVCIGVTTADCVPLLFYDPAKKVIAAVHAGWRGTVERIAEKTVHAIVEKCGSNPADIRVVIGPSISAGVYEVGIDVVERFKTNGFDCSKIVNNRNGAFYLDL